MKEGFRLAVDPSLKHVDVQRESLLEHKGSGMCHIVELATFAHALALAVASFPFDVHIQGVGKDMVGEHLVDCLRTYYCKLAEHLGCVVVMNIDSFASHKRFVRQSEHGLVTVPLFACLRPQLVVVAELLEQGSCSVPRI